MAKKKQQKKEKSIPQGVIIMAIGGLVVIECVAMLNGINGTFRSIVIAIIAGLAGFAIPNPMKQR